MVTEYEGHRFLSTSGFSDDEIIYKDIDKMYDDVYKNIKEDSLNIEFMLNKIIKDIESIKNIKDSVDNKIREICMKHIDKASYESSLEEKHEIFIENYYVDTSYAYSIAFKEDNNIDYVYRFIDIIEGN